MSELNHFRDDGAARIVDIGNKPESRRTAVARGRISMRPETQQLIRENGLKKGDALATSRLAGIMAAKETPRWIPLCHPVRLDHIHLEFRFPSDSEIEVEATTHATDRTGVEMEALVAVTAACLTLFDMGKGVDRTMIIGGVHVAKKTGGRSGEWEFAPPG